MSAPRRCIYTVLTGAQPPAAQHTARNSDIPFICFTNSPENANETWETRGFTPALPNDPERSATRVKLQPQLYLPDFDQSLYIDPNLLLRVPADQIFDIADLTSGLCLATNDASQTLVESFGAAITNRLDDPGRIAEQLGHYIPDFTDILLQPSLFTGFILRDHANPKTRAAMDIWAAHVLRYSKADHLSAAIVFAIIGLHPNMFTNQETYTIPSAANQNTGEKIPPAMAAAPFRAELATLQNRLGQLQHEHQIVLNATTWRVLAPLRAALRKLRR